MSDLHARDAVPAGDHRAHLVDRPGEHHHNQVNEDEGGEQHGAEEMDRTGRLAAAKNIEQPRPGGVHARRQGQASEDDERQ
jgi:hypothetical protein